MFWIAVILGIVEGLTEFLPISSTGHLIVTSHLLGFGGKRAEVFEIFIQLGAILAVVWEYRARLTRVAVDLPRRADARRFVMALFMLEGEGARRPVHLRLPEIEGGITAEAHAGGRGQETGIHQAERTVPVVEADLQVLPDLGQPFLGETAVSLTILCWRRGIRKSFRIWGKITPAFPAPSPCPLPRGGQGYAEVRSCDSIT